MSFCSLLVLSARAAAIFLYPLLGANRLKIASPEGRLLTKPDVVGEESHVALTLIDRNIDLARDLGPARDLPADHVSELLGSHGLGFGALIGEKRDELGRC